MRSKKTAKNAHAHRVMGETAEQHDKRRAATAERLKIINPNGGSDVKINDMSFGLVKKVVLGVPSFFEMHESPDAHIRIAQFKANVDTHGMFYIRDLRIANISVLIGGSVDAADLGEILAGCEPMTPANRCKAYVEYTGLIPESLKGTPKKEITVDSLVKLIEEMTKEGTLEHIQARLRGALKELPLFEFMIVASGPGVGFGGA